MPRKFARTYAGAVLEPLLERQRRPSAAVRLGYGLVQVVGLQLENDRVAFRGARRRASAHAQHVDHVGVTANREVLLQLPPEQGRGVEVGRVAAGFLLASAAFLHDLHGHAKIAAVTAPMQAAPGARSGELRAVHRAHAALSQAVGRARHERSRRPRFRQVPPLDDGDVDKHLAVGADAHAALTPRRCHCCGSGGRSR